MAANTYLDLDQTTGLPKQKSAVQTSGGASSAGQIPALGPAGTFDSSMFPAGFGEAALSYPTSENLAGPSLVNIWADAGVPTARNANATDTTKPAMGFVSSAVVAPANATVYFPNQLVGGFSGLTPGNRVFLSAATPGGVVDVANAPSAAGNLVQCVGYAVSTTEIIFIPEPGIIHG